jgi:hypothetical protein
MIDLLVNRVIGTRDEFGARYDLALFRIYDGFHDPRRDPLPRGRVTSFARDVLFHGLAFYEATLMTPGSASRHTSQESPSNKVHYIY